MNMLSNMRFDSFSRLMRDHKTATKPEAVVLFFLCVILGVLPACGTLAGLPLAYSAEAIEGWVVDVDTQQPLEGVIVTANWQLQGGFGIHSQYVGQLMIMETVTDQNGRFNFPAWGPRPTLLGQFLVNEDPRLVFFKNGYDFESLQNEPRSHINKASLRTSRWNGKTIGLKSFQPDSIIMDRGIKTSAYAKRIGSIQSSVDWSYSNSCDLKYIPRMIVALHVQEKTFRKQGIYSSLPSFDEFIDEKYPDRCGVRKTLRKYLP